MNEEIGELIFIRHGKAKIRNPAVDDTQRALTTTGREELKRIIPELKANLKTDLELHLWSSPSLRASQTAEIIANSIGNIGISQCQWIGSGDFSVFQNELLQIKTPFCLILVGNEPFLSDWSQKISGNQIPYISGTAIGFKILSLEPLKAVPKWIIQPEILRLKDLEIKMGNPVLNEYKKILHFQLQQIFRMQKQFIAEPDDQETNHQLRVKIRELRSILSFIKPLLNQEKCFNAQTRLRELAQRFAHLREIDVVVDEWSELLQIHPELAHGNGALMNALKAERAEEQSKVYQKVTDGIMSPVIFDLLIWINSAYEYENSQPKKLLTGLSFEDFTPKRFESLIKKADINLKKTDLKDLKSIHALRIQFKKLRYASSVLKPFIHLASKHEIAELTARQDHLGLICDAQRNLIISRELISKYSSSALQHECGILEGYQLSLADQQIQAL